MKRIQNAYVTMAMISLMAAYGSPNQALASTPSVQMPAVEFGVSQAPEADVCDAPNLLYSAVHDRLETRFEFMPSARGATPNSSWLTLEIVDLVTAGAYTPAIVAVHAQLERPGLPATQFRTSRQMDRKFPEMITETNECDMIDVEINELAVDIAQWMFSQFYPESP